MKKMRYLLLSFLSGGILVFVTLFLSFSSHATSVVVNDYVIPYVVPEFYTNNNLTTDYGGWDNLVSCLKSYLPQLESPSNFDWDNYIAYPIETQNTGKGVQYKILFNPSITYDVSEDLNFYQNRVTINYSRYINFRVYYDDVNTPGYNFYFSDFSRGNSGSSTIFYNYDPLDFYNGYYVQRYYPFILVGGDILDINGDVIITNIVQSTVNTGSAVEPDHFDKQQIHHQGHSRPGHVPVPPTYNSYTWNSYNPPSVDTSSLEALVESLFDLVKYNGEYIGTNIGGILNTFMSNVKLSFDYIGDTLDYHLGLIIDNIQSFNDNFYDNMVSLFEPIADTINTIGVIASTIVALGTDPDTNLFSIPYLTKTLFLPSPEDVHYFMEQNDSLHVASSIDIIVNKIWLSETSIIKTLQNVVPTPYFHVPSCIYHGKEIGDFDLDFSWFAAYKTYSDIIIGTFLWIGYLYWLFVSISHLIRFGKAYEYDETSVGGKKGVGVLF